MASNKSWNFENDEILIELVKGKRGLYDLQSQYYSDNNYKRKTWNEIEEAVGLPGAKNRWEGLRAQYRKYIAKLKTKSGQAATKISKWRYHNQMQFINQFIICDRPRISTIIHEEGDNEDIYDMDIEDKDRRTTVSNEIDGKEEVGLDIPVNTFTSNVPPARKKQNKQKNTGVQQEDASSTLMKYILDKKAEECTAHPIDNFFTLIAGTVKTFSAVDQHFIKTRVFTLVSEIEEKYIISAPKTSTSSESVHSQTQHTLLPSSSPLSAHHPMNAVEQYQATLYEMSPASNRN